MPGCSVPRSIAHTHRRAGVGDVEMVSVVHGQRSEAPGPLHVVDDFHAPAGRCAPSELELAVAGIQVTDEGRALAVQRQRVELADPNRLVDRLYDPAAGHEPRIADLRPSPGDPEVADMGLVVCVQGQGDVPLNPSGVIHGLALPAVAGPDGQVERSVLAVGDERVTGPIDAQADVV